MVKKRIPQRWMNLYYAAIGIPSLYGWAFGCYGGSSVCRILTQLPYLVGWVLLVILILNVHLFILNRKRG